MEKTKIYPYDREDKEYKKDMFDHVFIDVDSCLVNLEGIDELAQLHNCSAEVEGLTKAAMNGEILFEDVFSKRLEIIQPRKEDLETIGRQYLEAITPYAPEIIELLQRVGTTVWLISGGYDEVIYPLADYVGISRDHILANHLFFSVDGTYQGYDATNPLCRQFGKRACIKHLKEEVKITRKTAIIGDGVSEVEAKDVVDLCIGFGGYVIREKVRNEADIFVEEATFVPLLPYLLGEKKMLELFRDHVFKKRKDALFTLQRMGI